MATRCAGLSDTGPRFDHYGVPPSRVPRGKRRFASPGPELYQPGGSLTLPHEHEACDREANIPTAKRSRVKEEHHDAQDYQHYSAPYCSSLGSLPWNFLLVNQGLQDGDHVASVWPDVVQVPSYALFSPSFSDGVCSFPVSFPAYPQEFPISSSVTPANEPPLHRGENAPPPISLEAAPLQFTFGPIYKDVFNNSPVLNQAPFLPWSPHGFSYSRATGQQVHLDIPDDITSPTPQIALYSSPTQSMSPPKTGSTRNPCPSPPTLKSESSFGSSFELSERSPRAPDTPSDGIITPILIDNDATMSLSFHEVESVGRLHSASSNVPAVPLSTSPGGGLADSWDFVGKLEDDPSPKLAPLTDQSLDNSYVDIGEEKPHYSMLPQLDNGRTAIGKALQPSRGPPQPSETPKKRPIGEEARKRIFYTRKIGACLRCHMQRTKCEPSSEDTDADCMTCLKFDKTSKKTIHNLPCLRYKLTTITMYRTGGLGLTKRFPDNEVKNVDIIGTPFVIEIIHGFRGKPMRLEVGRFEPREGDVVTRQYGDGKEAHYAPFCLHSVEKTSEDFLQYLHDNAFAALGEAAQSEPGIIGQTLRVLMAHYFTLPDNPDADDSPGTKRGKDVHDQKQLLADAIRLWFAIRTGIGSASVVTNVELLGMERPGDDAPFQNENTVPRMIVAQFDAIRNARVFQKLMPKVLKRYESFLTSKNTKAWFTIYLVTFLFLGLVSSASADRLRSARQKTGKIKPETRYGPVNSPLTTFVEELQKSGVVLLLYWHYFKRVDDLMAFPWGDLEARKTHHAASYVEGLEDEQFNFLDSTVKELKLIRERIPQEPSEGCWENPLYWISYMFESAPSAKYTWAPPETFSLVKPSVGRW